MPPVGGWRILQEPVSRKQLVCADVVVLMQTPEGIADPTTDRYAEGAALNALYQHSHNNTFDPTADGNDAVGGLLHEKTLCLSMADVKDAGSAPGEAE